MAIADKKKKIIAYLTKHLDELDPSGANSKRYKDMLENMSDRKFDEFMKNMRDGNYQLHLIMPNMVRNMKMEDIIKAAKSVGTKLFHRLVLVDEATGKKYLTNEEYPVFQVPCRRLQQYVDKKLRVPDSDTSIDGLTGQVTGDDKTSSITHPEIQSLYIRGLDKTLEELLRVRGGDIHAYGDFKSQMEESGEGEMGKLSPLSRTRSSAIMSILFQGMHLDLNI